VRSRFSGCDRLRGDEVRLAGLPASKRSAACIHRLIVCLIALVSLPGTAAVRMAAPHDVFVLNSNGRLFPANLEGGRALLDRFGSRADRSIALASECLDSPHLGGQCFELATAACLRETYAAAPTDVIMAAELAGEPTIECLNGLQTDDLSRRLRELPVDTIGHSPGLFVDDSGRPLLPRDSVRLNAADQAAPVYGTFSALVGAGIVGGRVTGLDAMADRGADAVLPLLDGASPESLDLPAVMPTVLYLAWRQLQRWANDPRSLPVEAVVQFRTPIFWDDYWRSVLLDGVVMLLHAGFITALLVERHRHQGTVAALMQSEQHMSLAARAAGLSMWVLTAGGRPSAPPDDALGRSCFGSGVLLDFAGTLEHVHPSDRERVEVVIHDALASGEEFEVEYRIVGAAGAVRRQSARGRADHGLRQRLLGVVSDVTQRRHAEAEAAQNHAVLQHLTRAALLGQLSASIAHQLNQPLASILGNAEAAQRMLLREPLDIAELREICADIVAEDRRAAEVIRCLVALFKGSPPSLVPFDLNELVRDTVDLTRTNPLMPCVALVVRLAPDLPTLEGDRVQLQQTLLNLIVNAADAMNTLPESERVLTISTAKEGRMIRLCVADRGAGVPAESMDKLFEPFWSTKADGMGIGLAVSKSIVDAHHGALEVSNAPEGGAVFCVCLPARALP
jgi:signal transduction histidine kinase